MAWDGVRTPAQIGSQIFSLLSGLALAYALFSGVRCTADCLSEEKRSGTLGLLFLTDLKGYDVVLGKLVANSLEAVYGLVAVLPVLAVPLLLGSVTGSEFWRMNLLLLNALIFSLTCELLISTFG
jgi:ABC-type transport system involved in cytochrome c biogenesis permease component